MTIEKAIEILSDVGDINRCCTEDAEALDMAIKALEQQPTRPTGKWKEYLDEGGFLYCECLNCGHITNEPDNYCPNCGSYNGGRGRRVLMT